MSLPANIARHNHRFYEITNAAYWFGLLGHAGGPFLFWYLGITELALFSLFFSIPAFALAIWLNRRGSHNLAFVFAFLELLLHQVLTTWCLGWEIGAHYLLLYLAGLLFFNPRWNRNVQYILLGFIAATYLAMYILLQEPVYHLDVEVIWYVNVSVAVSVMVAISLLINYFAQNTLRAEQRLIWEKNLTQRLLRKVESLFGQQISKEIATEMIESDRELEAKIYEATIMFMDMRDFTVYVDSHSPREVASFQNAVFGALIETIQEHQGVVVQLLGDGLMAVFGAPQENAEHADLAVQAGFRILDRVEELVKEKRIPAIRVGIGLNSGNVLAGNIGNAKRKAYSLTGKHVIIAARIEPLNKEFHSQFLVSGSVLAAMKGKKPEATDLGPIQLKGIEKLVSVFRLK